MSHLRREDTLFGRTTAKLRADPKVKAVNDGLSDQSVKPQPERPEPLIGKPYQEVASRK